MPILSFIPASRSFVTSITGIMQGEHLGIEALWRKECRALSLAEKSRVEFFSCLLYMFTGVVFCTAFIAQPF